MMPLWWALVVAAVGAMLVADRPCPDCGRWFQHALLCPRRTL